MNEKDSNRLVIAGYIAAIGVFLGAIALVIAALRIGWDNASAWFILVVQVLIASLTTIGLIVFAVVAVIIFSIMVDNLKSHHAEGVRTVTERTPTFAAAMVLGAEAVRVFADKSFQGDRGSTIILSLFLLVGFGIANQLALSVKKSFGIGMWYVSALIYPVFYLWDRQWKVGEVINDFAGLDLSTQVILALAVIVIAFLPIVFPQEKSAH
jgi:hypothetical protein